MEEKLTDESIMPSGQYKGKRMIDVPGKYFWWLYDNNKCTKQVKEYIEENLQVIKAEVGIK